MLTKIQEEKFEFALDIITDIVESYKTCEPKKKSHYHRLMSNTLYDVKNEGFRTGLASINATRIYNTTEKKLDVQKYCTFDHVYGRQKVGEIFCEKFAKGATRDEMKTDTIKLLCSIRVTRAENQVLSQLCKKNQYSIDELLNMQHYRDSEIYLALDPYGKAFSPSLFTKGMVSIITNNVGR